MPIHLKDITAEVLKSPRKLRAKAASEARELTTQTRLQIADGLEFPDLIITALAHTGCEVAAVIGMELLKWHVKALHNAKIQVILLTAGKTALAGGTQGVTVTMSLPVITPEGCKVFKCLNGFLNVAAVGPRLILGYPLLLAFGLALVPGQEAQVRGCFKGYRVPRYQHGKSQPVQHATSALQSVEATHLDSKKRENPRTDIAQPVDESSDVRNSGVHLVPQGNQVQFATEVSHQWCIECEDQCSRVHFTYDVQQSATCEQCGPIYTPVGVLHRRREGVRRNVLSLGLPDTLDDETAMPRGIPGTRSQPTK